MASVLEDLNEKQRRAVTTTQGPLLIIAGAGTGKTTVITRRIAYLIEKKLAKPSEILALTFTEKAASEMEERVDVLVPYGYVDTWISTFHAFGNRVLAENALDLGLPPDFKVMSFPQQVLFFQQNLFAFELDYYRPLSNPTKFIGAILSFISRCKDEDISPDDYLKHVKKLAGSSTRADFTKEEWKIEIARQRELASVYSRYEELKKAAGKLDYSDLIGLTLGLFRRRPTVLGEYQEKFKYLLVDEYQDTNYSQNELVKMLSNSHKNICVVGDDDQSIYKFRGAAVSNILKFTKDYPKAEQIVLTENYRATQELLDSSYRLVQHNNPDRLEVKNKIDKRLKSIRKEVGRPPLEYFGETISEEADFVASEIEKLIDNKKGKLKYKDIAILVRANAQADPFLHSLNLKGIPNKFVGSSGLYSQAEIRLLISFLTVVSNFDDSLNLYSLATSEIYQLPMKDAIVSADLARRRNKPLSYIFRHIEAEELEISEEGKEVIEKINKDLTESIELSRKENAGRVLYDFIKKTELLTRLEKAGEAEAAIKIQNIAKFFDKIKEFIELAQNESSRQFIEYLETMRLAGDDPATAEFDPDLDAVNVMTVHAAKGLEFSVVFMVNLVADRFPSRERAEPIALPEELIKETLPQGDFHLQEERRLFYVGSTRARNSLFYTWSRDAGGKRLKKVSPFVLEALDKPVSQAVPQKKSPLEKIEQFALAPRQVEKKGQAPALLRLTQASIDDYETCAYKYRYAHVLRIPILRHHAVIYGFALHSAVAFFYQNKMKGRTPNLDEVYSVLENSWVAEGFLSAEHEEKRLLQAKEVTRAFWEREKTSTDLPTYVEKPFRFSLRGEGVDVLVTGRYDRVDERDGRARIIDFKSTEKRTEEQLKKTAKESIQLKVYTLAYYRNFGVVPEFVGIYDLDSGIVAGYEPNKEAIEETQREVLEVAKAVKLDLASDSFKANPKYFGRLPACYYCAYSAICPFSLAK